MTKEELLQKKQFPLSLHLPPAVIIMGYAANGCPSTTFTASTRSCSMSCSSSSQTKKKKDFRQSNPGRTSNVQIFPASPNFCHHGKKKSQEPSTPYSTIFESRKEPVRQHRKTMGYDIYIYIDGNFLFHSLLFSKAGDWRAKGNLLGEFPSRSRQVPERPCAKHFFWVGLSSVLHT